MPRSGPTTAQLRDDIDSGRTGGKVAAFDPAAAPLGTDEEAAGTPPSPNAIAMARETELANAPTDRDVNRAGGATEWSGILLWLAAVAFVIAIATLQYFLIG